MIRDVRALLFCKITPTLNSNIGIQKSHLDIYEEICKVNTETYPHQEDKRVFFAFGGFDAIITYKPKLSDGTEWLHDIYNDKQNIIRSNSPNVVYHQMHLISHHDGNNLFWNAKDDDYPFFLTTLVYGVRRSDDIFLEAEECSTYEHVIREHIEAEKLTSDYAFQYAVYNGISISDVVILWRAKDIGSIVEVISKIEYSGTARKTITTLGFPMEDDGRIKSCVFRCLCNQGGKEKLRLSIHGSIKNRDLFRELYLEMSEGQAGSYLVASEPVIQVLNNTSQQSLSLGKNDFIVSAHVDGFDIAKLLEFYYARHTHLTNACWEILTDFRKKDDGANLQCKPVAEPSDILSNIYKDFLNRAAQLHDYPWCNAMLELLGTHYYIDHHPVLHGPSYLIYDSLNIANDYFFGNVQDFTEEDILRTLLMNSEEGILNYIHNLDQLTEQITRNDDAMLNNRSNSHSIHFSLPESALDFYHAFLRRIVDYLVEYDKCTGRKPQDFEYDFLLSPKVSRRFRFAKMFQTNYRYRSKEEANSRMIWPRKQAYILELPVESVFTPLDFFIPAVHECFHCFGDALRSREMRRQDMALFLSAVIMTAAGCAEDAYSEISDILAKMIYFGPEYDPNKISRNHSTGAYLENVKKELVKNTYYVLGTKGLERLFELSGRKYHQLYSNSVIQFWNDAQNNFFASRAQGFLNTLPNSTVMEKVIDQCEFYFKECYADAMTIALLKLTPLEYLERIAPEANRHFEKIQYLLNGDTSSFNATRANENTAIHAQRIAVVLTACCRQQYVETFSKKLCEDALNQMKSDKYGKLVEIIEKCFGATYNNDKKMPNGRSYLPSAALEYVIDYLINSIDKMYQNAPLMSVYTKAGKESYSLHKLVEDFDLVIRKGNMFGKRFYELIYQHHDNILRKIDKLNISL